MLIRPVSIPSHLKLLLCLVAFEITLHLYIFGIKWPMCLGTNYLPNVSHTISHFLHSYNLLHILAKLNILKWFKTIILTFIFFFFFCFHHTSRLKLFPKLQWHFLSPSYSNRPFWENFTVVSNSIYDIYNYIYIYMYLSNIIYLI